MSVQLEQDAVYLLPNAIDGTHYALLRATRENDRWILREEHGVPHGNEAFRARAELPIGQQLAFGVGQTGDLVPLQRTVGMTERNWTLMNLSLFGYLRDGKYVQPPEGL